MATSNITSTKLQSLISEMGHEEELERLSDKLYDKFVSDDEVPRKKGFYLAKAYLENPKLVDDVLIAICGWSMKSLLIFAELIPDDEGLLN